MKIGPYAIGAKCPIIQSLSDATREIKPSPTEIIMGLSKSGTAKWQLKPGRMMNDGNPLEFWIPQFQTKPHQ